MRRPSARRCCECWGRGERAADGDAMKSRRWRVAVLLVEVVLVLALIAMLVPPLRARAIKLVRPRADVAARVVEYGAAARERMIAGFKRAGVEYPPRSLVLTAFKQEKRLEVYASASDGTMRMVLEYPILAASGGPGPKLRRGDNQVPEGLYGVESLNPNSLYHLALRIGYPNDEDRAHAREDGREDLGGDIMIHGGAGSVGCLAMGDPAIEELFVMAADVGVENATVVLSPIDFRLAGASVDMGKMPSWVGTRYGQLRARLASLPSP